MRAAPSIHVPLGLHIPRPVEVRAYWAVTTGVGVLALWLVAFYAPVDGARGPVQKLVYMHISAAAAAMLAAVASFGASLAYIWTRGRVWEHAASAAARVVVFGTLIVLATGMIWGKSEWGMWWTWSPKLTFTLILCVLYAVPLLLGQFVPAPRRAMVCAVYGAIAFLDAPLVYLSVRLLPDVHPTSLPFTIEMRVTLGVWLAFALLAGGGLIATPIVRWARRVGHLRHIEHAA